MTTQSLSDLPPAVQQIQDMPALPVVAWLYQCWDTQHLLNKQNDHYFSVDGGETKVKGEPLCKVSDALAHAKSLLLRLEAAEQRERVLREKYERPIPETERRDKDLDARRYEVLRSCRGMEHDPEFAVHDGEGHVLWGGDLDFVIDKEIEHLQDIYGDAAALALPIDQGENA